MSELYRDLESRFVVDELDTCRMEVGHGSDQGKSKSASRRARAHQRAEEIGCLPRSGCAPPSRGRVARSSCKDRLKAWQKPQGRKADRFTIKDISRALKRTPGAFRRKARNLGIPVGHQQRTSAKKVWSVGGIRFKKRAIPRMSRRRFRLRVPFNA